MISLLFSAELYDVLILFLKFKKLLLHEEMPTNQLSYSPEDSSSKLGVIFENVSARYDDV